jgi:hypothetical protein
MVVDNRIATIAVVVIIIIIIYLVFTNFLIGNQEYFSCIRSILVCLPHQQIEMYKKSQTTSTKCQYQAAASNPKW